MVVYNGELSITEDSKNTKEGSAVGMAYKIRNRKWNLLARIKIDTTNLRETGVGFLDQVG